MGEKRVVPQPLKGILDWDVAMTDKFVKYVDKKHGPLSKYKGVMTGLEVCVIISSSFDKSSICPLCMSHY